MEYKIVRMYFHGRSRVIKRGLSLEDARAHCSNPETSSQTCVKAINIRRTRMKGPWFDSYDEG